MKKLYKLLMLLTLTILLSTSLMAQMTLKFTTATAGEDITLPLHGTVSVTVNWGDGTSTNYITAANRTHTYSTAGTHTVNISAYNSANPALTQYGNGVTYSNVDKLTEVTSFGSLGITSFFGAFYGATNLTVVPTSLPTGVTDVSNMFYGASTFNGDISAWDVSDVTDMGAMFYGASIFNQNISTWDVSKVTDMGAMFRLAKAFNQNISTWERTGSSLSNVTNMGGMFQSAIVFNQNIGNWVVTKVNNMAWMFFNAAVFDGDIGDWDVTEVTSMAAMLGDAKAFNQDIGDWNISKVTDMTSMFYQATSFNQDISTWERTSPPATSASSLNDVLKMKNMFNGAKVFNQDIGNWDVSKVNDMMQMFYGATAFNQDLGDWDVSLVTNMTDMFNGVTLSKTNYDALLIGWKNRTLTADVVFSAGSSVCSPGPAAEARQYIIDTYGWVFTDGGIDPLTWDGSTDSDWNDADNWNYTTLPISTYDVIIANVTNDPVITPTGTASCNDLTINSGATLTIQSTTAGTGSLIVEGTASGNVIFKRYVDEASKAATWHYVSSPVAGQSLTGWMSANSIAQNNTQYKFYRFDEDTDYWIYYGYTGSAPEDFGDATFIDARGYCLTRGSAGELSFTGTVRTDDLNYAATYTSGEGDGFNLVGNPFTSSLMVTTTASTDDNFLTVNTTLLDDSYEALYIWDEQTSYSNKRNDYKVISNSTITGYPILSQHYIAPGQAFMVKVASSGNLAFNENMQAHNNATYYKNDDDVWPSVELIVENEELFNSTAIGFNENMTKGLDPSYDVGKLKGNPDIALYTKLIEDNGVDFAIQALPTNNPQNLIVSVGVDVLESQELVFSVNTTELDNYDIILEDRSLNIFTDLNKNTYTATITQSGTGRFYLHFRDIDGINDDDYKLNTIRSYTSSNTLYILNPKMKRGTVTIYNLTGQKVATFKLTGDTKQQQTLNMINIINIVKIQTGDGVLSQKVIFR